MSPHEEFGNRLLPGASFVDGDAQVDQLGHGTSVASVAAGAANDFGGVGVCPECSILPIQVATNSGFVPWSAAAQGIIWAVDHEADVINLSFGGTTDSPLMRDAIAYAQTEGVAVIAAAGNYGTSNPTYPAYYDGVVSVADHDRDLERYSWSSHGDWTDIAAPGCMIALRSDEAKSVCGTSYASPWVAGVAGLLLSDDPSLTPEQVEATLVAAAEPNTFTNHGRVVASMAITSPVRFGNVDPGSYYADAVNWMVDEEITTGTSPTSFSPNDNVTRAQLATFLWRFADSPATATAAGSNNPGERFSDLDTDSYYSDAVNWMVDEEITTGTSPTSFSPNDNVTRAQLATFLWRFADSPATATAAGSNNPGERFSDLDTDSYYSDAVNWMVDEEITTGTSPTSFSPNDNVTRAQLATFLWRFADSPATATAAGSNNPGERFSDLDTDSYYSDAVNWMVDEEITTGTSPTSFSPNDNVTRAQLATFLWRLADAV